MSKTIKKITLILVMIITSKIFAQERIITGVVSDQSNLPLPGANVLVKGTKRGVSTDIDGKYSIKATIGETLVFQFIGFMNQEIKVGSSNSINVKLKENAVLIEEHYGCYPIKRNQNLPSSTTISEEELRNPPRETTQVRTHCIKSINPNNKPLIIMDEEIISENILKTIDPNSIATIKVLKDKEAIEIYGSKAQFGVIIIETKEYQEENK